MGFQLWCTRAEGFNATLAFKSGLLAGKLTPARLRLAQAALGVADAALVLSQGSLRTITGACVTVGVGGPARMLLRRPRVSSKD